MTKEQMTDSILFAVRELAKAREQLDAIINIQIANPPAALAGSGSGDIDSAAYTLGRAEGMAFNARLLLDLAADDLRRCVPPAAAALICKWGSAEHTDDTHCICDSLGLGCSHERLNEDGYCRQCGVLAPRSI